MDFLNDIYQALRNSLSPTIRPYLEPVLTIVGLTLLGVLVRILVIKRLQRIGERTKTPYDDIIIDIFRRRMVFWTLIVSVLLVLPLMPWEPSTMKSVEIGTLVVLILSITHSTSKMFADIVSHYSNSTGSGLGGTTLIRYLGSFALYVTGLLIILSMFGISPAPAIATLGVGGLAIALAFQDTLANVFAGIYITISQQIRIGDFIELATKQEGFVHDISWRTTTIRTFTNNMIIVPNKQLSESIIINYHLPEPKLAVELNVGVSYDCDPYHVEAVLRDIIAGALGEIEGLQEDTPVVRFREFGDSALQFRVFVFVNQFEFKHLVAHDIMKRIYRRFKNEGITIPFPIRTLHFPDGVPASLQKSEEGTSIDSNNGDNNDT